MYKLFIIFCFCGSRNTFADISGIIDTLTPCIRLKEECPNERVTFWLYTRENMDVPHELKTGNIESFQRAPFVNGSPVFITIHGFTGSREWTPNRQVKPALLVRGDFNIIAVDYNSTVKSPCYLSAVKNLDVVANCTAMFIDFMLKTMEIPLEQVHVIGFSLGAHVSGMISNFIQIGKLKHITGLDPALPLFMTSRMDWKLDAKDADFVDVVHTNVLVNGKLEPSGDVDFYINSGIAQPGCENINVYESTRCDHRRASEYYAESINTKIGFYGRQFPSLPCRIAGNCKTVVMGFDVPLNARGIYLVDTNSQPPFAQGMP